MRLGFDLDGTIADMQGALARIAHDLCPEVDPATLPRSVAEQGSRGSQGSPGSQGSQGSRSSRGGDERQTSGAPGRALTARQQGTIWAAACAQENFWETLDEIEPGALARLSRLVREHGWEIIFLTSRPETAGDRAQAQSHRWLAAHGFAMPSVFVVHGSRGRIASALQLDIVVDDRPENCLDVSIDSRARAVLVWRGAQTELPASARQLGIGAVASLAECFDVLERLDRAETGGFVDRFRRLLGLTRDRRGERRPADSNPGH